MSWKSGSAMEDREIKAESDRIRGFAVLTEPCPHCDGAGTRLFVSGAAMEAHRKALGRSLRYTAGQIGVTAPYLHDVEYGRRRATDRVVNGYAALTPAKGGAR